MMKLKYEPYLPVSEIAHIFVVQSANLYVIDKKPACIGFIKCAQNIQ